MLYNLCHSDKCLKHSINEAFVSVQFTTLKNEYALYYFLLFPQGSGQSFVTHS